MGSGLWEDVDVLVAHGHQFACHFANKVSHLIYQFGLIGTDDARALACPVLWDTFWFIQFKDGEMTLESLFV